MSISFHLKIANQNISIELSKIKEKSEQRRLKEEFWGLSLISFFKN